jgi:hypothetical protein
MDNLKSREKAEKGTTLVSLTQEAAGEGAVRSYQEGTFCPNCGGRLTGRKCKLFCETPGCGYLVTCSEF